MESESPALRINYLPQRKYIYRYIYYCNMEILISGPLM